MNIVNAAALISVKCTLMVRNRCQLDVFKSQAVNQKDAISLTNKLKKYGAYYVKKTKGSKTYYRVRCGSFSSKKEAEVLRERLLKDVHLKGIIVRCK
jgi:cell division septation protein DedD